MALWVQRSHGARTRAHKGRRRMAARRGAAAVLEEKRRGAHGPRRALARERGEVLATGKQREKNGAAEQQAQRGECRRGAGAAAGEKRVRSCGQQIEKGGGSARRARKEERS